MGCFLACFRVKDGGSRTCQLFSKSYTSNKREPLVDRNQFTSVVSYEDKGAPSDKEEREIMEDKSDGDGSLYENLRQEAKFLKTCGAILETPIEIRNASVLHYDASDPCCKKIDWDQQLDNIDDFPTKAPETTTSEGEKHKRMVLFEELKNSPGEQKPTESEISPEGNYQTQPSSSGSPYPTPLSLVNGLQTPGTIYPPKSDKFRIGTVKTQFVFGVSDLSQRPFELNISGEARENTPTVPPASVNKEASGWLKPPLARNESKKITDFREEQFHSQNSSDVDRPIIGAAAAHWSEQGSSRISTKEWDGNGIPNSTTKYKEDQKVSWHAIPFEVRLEKALSDEKALSSEGTCRKIDGDG